MELGILRRSSFLMPLVVAVVGLSVRVAYVHESNRDIACYMPIIDAAAYHVQAQALIGGVADDGKPFWQPPLYPYWLSLVYRWVGVSPSRVRYVQALQGALACVLVFFLGLRVHGKWVGFVAGMIVAVNGPMVFFDGQLLPATLAAVLNLSAVLALTWAVSGRGYFRWLAFGAVVGFAALTVPNALVFLCVGLVAIIYMSARDRKWRLGSVQALASCFGVLLVIAPVTVRNYRVSGQFVPISTNGGINLFIGNNKLAPATVGIRPGLDWGRLVRLPFEHGAANDTEAQRFFLRETATYALERPSRLVAGMFRKAAQFCSSVEIPRNVDPYVFAERVCVLDLLLWRIGGFGFPFGIIAALSLAGLLLVHRRSSGQVVLLACVVAYSASVVLFFVTSRYRIPVVPLFAILAALGIVRVVEVYREGRRKWALGVVAACAIGLVLVSIPVTHAAAHVNFDAELENAIGAGLELRGNREEASVHYTAALEIEPEFYEARYNLANTQRLMGFTATAEANYRVVLSQRPDYDKAHNNLGVTLAGAGNTEEAIEHFRESMKHDRWNPRTYLNLGVCLVRVGKVEKGIEHLRTSLKLNPNSAAAIQNIGSALLKLGRTAEAVEYFQKSLAINPNNAVAHNNLGVALLSLNRRSAGINHLRTAIKIDPDYREALINLVKTLAARETR